MVNIWLTRRLPQPRAGQWGSGMTKNKKAIGKSKMPKVYAKLRRAFQRLWRDETGASLGEYIVIITLVLIGVGLAFGVMTGALTDSMSSGIDGGIQPR